MLLPCLWMASNTRSQLVAMSTCTHRKLVMMCTGDERPPKKPLSPLAMAAMEMLEEQEQEEMARLRMQKTEAEDEEDELAAYWDRYDESKRLGVHEVDREALLELREQSNAEELPQDKAARTEYLLNRYYARYGIDKATEDLHRADIEVAIATCKRDLAERGGGTAAALLALRKVEPFVQANSKLGSAFLFELARAHETAGHEDDARRIYESLQRDHPQSDVRREARTLLATVKSRTMRLSGAQQDGGWWGGGQPQWTRWRSK
jgi:hypothetical protein